MPEQQTDDLCVTRVPLFQGLTREQQLEVARVARPTRFARNEQIYPAGSEMSQLMVVHTGRVKISRITPDGREQLLRVLEPGDFAGESAFLSGARSDHEATGVEAGSLCAFRHADLGRLVEKHPGIGWRMLQSVSRRLDATESRLAAVISGDVSARLAGYLLSLPVQARGGAGVVVAMPLPKKDIASLLDTTPESLSRQLRRLSDSGLIRQQPKRRVEITDVDALTALAGLD
ncbi:Crp/Fnr family transcriptional regulator [Microbacterium protaetiae]|uniref:Crp/Fnr family transcriptional regulator n=1 Tax=Microbacterium protaetiae TaxID=2509458 RepID=A0A4P6EGQ2_9MICO|nr:Crp/Fnr family transcriptional regulator [Microbacterium protaetiae]QAY60349.1 Crp/Fnr family transcriptional regulator [Microbacterium protaetiae]